MLPAIILALVGLIALPQPLVFPKSGLDPSHAIGIRVAFGQGWQFGREIIFTYGPLGWVGPTYVDYGQWLASLIVSIFVHAGLLVSVYFLVARERSPWFSYLGLFLLAPILIFFKVDYKILFLAVILLYFGVVRGPSRTHYLLATVAIALLAAVSLYKFNMMLGAASILAGLFIVLALRRRYLEWLFAALAYAFLVLVFWSAAGQAVANLPRYVSTGYQLSSGYSAAMAFAGPGWHLYLAGVAFVFLATVLFHGYARRDQQVTAFIWLAGGPLFLAFKHGFVRHDGHILIFFGASTLFFVCLSFISPRPDRRSWTQWSSLAIALALVFSLHSVYAPVDASPWVKNLKKRMSLYRTSLALIAKPSFRAQIENDNRTDIRRSYAIVEPSLGRPGKDSWDSIPWEVALLWGYDLDWRPRPVFQSYSAYTPALDKVNARHFSSPRAPTAVLYRYGSIDDRYPLFDEPLTVVKVLRNYEVKEQIADFLVLTRRRTEKPMKVERLGTTTVETGRPFPVPSYQDGRVFAEIEMDPGPLGRTLDIFYKPAVARIQFIFADGRTRDYRFVPAVAKNPVLISDWIDYSGDLAALFAGERTKRIRSVRISADNPAHYSKTIKVTFLGVKGL